MIKQTPDKTKEKQHSKDCHCCYNRFEKQNKLKRGLDDDVFDFDESDMYCKCVMGI